MSDQNTKEGLKRAIGVRALAANIVNITVGAGIYVLPAIVAANIGAASVLAYIFCAAMLISIMLCYAEIGSRVTGAGGSYKYVEAAFGPFAGFIVNWLFFISWGSAASAALMNVVADSLAIMFPVFSQPIVRAVLFFVLIGLVILVNVRGTKQGVRVVGIITLVKLVPLLGIIIFGVAYVKPGNLHWEHLPEMKTFGETVLVLFYAFAGFETALNTSGELESPKRTIPRGILLGGALIFTVYLVIQFVTQGVLGPQINAFKDAPLAAVANKIVGPVGATLLVVAAMVSSFGTVSGDVLATPRLLFAGANDGLFPKFLGKVHPRFATPYMAVITYGALIFIFSISGGFRELAILSSGSLLLIYLGVVLATVRMRYKKGQTTQQSFKVSGGLIVPLIAIVTIIWLLTHLSISEISANLLFIAFVCIIYFVMKFFKNNNILDKPEGTIEYID